MNKKMLVGLAISIIICSALLFEQASSEPMSKPSKLKIFVGPTSVPADDRVYNCVFVQLQDSSGKPARAVQDTTISLSSSNTNIGTVDPSIIIRSGTTYGSADFHSTFSPGTTSIAATASGYATVQASVTTVGPNPTSIAVYGFPSTLPADGGSYDALLVQLQDSSSSPAKAPKGGIQVILSCSNGEIGAVTSPVIIPEGQTYAIASFKTTTTAGQAVITPVSSGYVSKQTTVATKAIGGLADSIQIWTGTPKVLAEKNEYRHIAVQLYSGGNLATASSNINVTLSSSDKTVGIMETSLIVPQSKTYALATLTTTYKAGTTTITAAATNLTAAQQTISTIGFTPSQLAVYCVPSTLPSDNQAYETIQVQLQDSQGRPAKDPVADVTVSLFSSKPEVGEVDSTLTIPFGETHATGEFAVTNAPGSTSVTAQASSYTTGEATITTHTIDFSALDIALTAPESMLNGNETEVVAYVEVEGSPVTGAIVKFGSNNGGTFTATQENEAGFYKATFTAPSFSKTTSCTITANASKTGFVSSQVTAQIAVGPTVATIDPTNMTKGSLQLRIHDSNGDSLSDVIVTSAVQPQGAKKLAGITNETGYVTFKNATTGLYTFTIVKEGYEALNQTINFKGTTSTWTLILLGNTQGDNTLLIVAAVVIVVVIVAIGVVLHRRRNSDNDLSDYSKYFDS